MNGPPESSGPQQDWLWDRSGPVDPEVRELETLLGRYGHDGRPLDLRLLRKGGRRPRWGLPLLAAGLCAAAAAAVLFVWLRGEAPLHPGAAPRSFVAGGSAEDVRLGELAAITLEPGAELRFEHWRADEARFALARGAIEVQVAPPPLVPPRFFQVATPAGLVVDLGCRYRLELRADGGEPVEQVRVREGAVEFAAGTRTVLVPAGAGCRVRDGRPSTPVFAGAEGELRDLVEKLDAADAAGPWSEPGMRRKLADRIAAVAETGRDTLVLWHLLRDADPFVAEVAGERLLEIAGPPPGAGKGGGADPELWLPWLRRGAWTEVR